MDIGYPTFSLKIYPKSKTIKIKILRIRQLSPSSYLPAFHMAYGDVGVGLRPGLVAKNFHLKLSHRILRHMHGVLNIDEKKLIAQFG